MNIHIDSEVLNEVYIPFIEDMQHKFFILYGGAGSGKSYAVAQKIIFRAINEKGIRILVIRKTKTSQKESCFKLICSVLKEWKLYSLCKVNLSDLTITLPNGSEIIFLGTEDPERIKSFLNPAILWYEEVSECKDENEFDQLALRIRSPHYKNQIYLSLNPTTKSSFVYKRWFAPGVQVPNDTYILKTTYKDNKFLTRDYIENLENLINTNNVFFRIYAKGEWASLDKTVYTNWKVEDFDYHTIKGVHLVGLDFGFSLDTSALVESIVNKDEKKLYIFREWGDTGKTNPELARIIKDMGLAKSQIIADSAEPKSITELKREGIINVHPSKKGPDSIIYGIQKLQQYQIIIHPSCKNTIEEIENYCWKKDSKTGEYINEPSPGYDHYMDALRYSIQILQKPEQGLDVKKIFSI